MAYAASNALQINHRLVTKTPNLESIKPDTTSLKNANKTKENTLQLLRNLPNAKTRNRPNNY